MPTNLPEKLDRIEAILCAAANVDRDILHSPNREQEYADVRAAIWYVARHYLGYTYPGLGRIYKRDHTTVIHGVSRIEGMSDPAKRKIVDGIRAVDPGLLIRTLEEGKPRPIDAWKFQK